MKITKQYLKQLIRESLEEAERLDPREVGGAYGVDPTGEMGKEVRDAEAEAEESEALRELEEAITSLMNVAKKLAAAEKKEIK